MAASRPPTLDPVAALRWQRAAPARPPWLHEEVGRRMAERLQWIRLEPQAWADWGPVRGGLEAHAQVAARYPRAACWIVETEARRAAVARERIARPWWRLGTPALHHAEPPPGGVQMVWANMALHAAPEPGEVIARWHAALAPDGFLMFSCLGPDTVRELRALFAAAGWPPAGQEFTDMHDWGDMLVHAGFAEPVMDMERVTLTWDAAGRLLEELRQLGANLHPRRFPALRGRGWRARLERELDERLRGPDGRLALTFEIIYGHALRPQPRVAVTGEAAVPLHDMQRMLRGGKRTP